MRIIPSKKLSTAEYVALFKKIAYITCTFTRKCDFFLNYAGNVILNII